VVVSNLIIFSSPLKQPAVMLALKGSKITYFTKIHRLQYFTKIQRLQYFTKMVAIFYQDMEVAMFFQDTVVANINWQKMNEMQQQVKKCIASNLL
jgi:hypothetical protein